MQQFLGDMQITLLLHCYFYCWFSLLFSFSSVIPSGGLCAVFPA